MAKNAPLSLLAGGWIYGAMVRMVYVSIAYYDIKQPSRSQETKMKYFCQ